MPVFLLMLVNAEDKRPPVAAGNEKIPGITPTTRVWRKRRRPSASFLLLKIFPLRVLSSLLPNKKKQQKGETFPACTHSEDRVRHQRSGVNTETRLMDKGSANQRTAARQAPPTCRRKLENEQTFVCYVPTLDLRKKRLRQRCE